MSILLTIFDKKAPREIKPGHEARAGRLLALWRQNIGRPRFAYDGDYEDFYEQAARLDAAITTFGSDIWLHVVGRKAVHLDTRATRPAEELSLLPRYGAQPGNIHTLSRARDEQLASTYFHYDAVTSRYGRRAELADWEPDETGEDFIRVVRGMLNGGVRDFFVKFTHTKLGIFEFSLPADASDDLILRRLGENAGYTLASARSGKDVFLVQERIRMFGEYRIFVVGQHPVTGAGCIEQYTPLDNTSPFDPRVQEEREPGARIARDPAYVESLVRFAEELASELADEQPDLQNYVVDIAVGENGPALVIELNGLLNSGLYASNPTLVTKALQDWYQQAQGKLSAHSLTDGPDRSLACTCGEITGKDGFIDHAAAAAGIGVWTARELLDGLHQNDVLNEGACGGCEHCGTSAQMALCRVCGEGYSPCYTYELARDLEAQPVEVKRVRVRFD